MDIKDNRKKEILNALDEAMETALDAAGMQAATLSARELQKSPSRIDTGLLRNSITWALGGGPAAISSYSGDSASKHTGKAPESGSYSGTAPADEGSERSVYVGTNVEYAVYVHEGVKRVGTKKNGKGEKKSMEPNRFLKNGIMDNRDELSEIIKKTLQNG